MANMHLMFGHIYSNEDEAHSLFQEHFLHHHILDQKPFLPFSDSLGNTAHRIYNEVTVGTHQVCVNVSDRRQKLDLISGKSGDVYNKNSPHMTVSKNTMEEVLHILLHVTAICTSATASAKRIFLQVIS